MNSKLNNSCNKLNSCLQIQQFEYCYIFPAIIELSEYLGNWKLIIICNHIINNKKQLNTKTISNSHLISIDISFVINQNKNIVEIQTN